MLLFLPETLGAVINVDYYETPEGFCCDDGHSQSWREKKEIQKVSVSCCFLSNYLHEVWADKYIGNSYCPLSTEPWYVS